MRVYLNGAMVDSNEAKISMDDRGFLFADALYEVVHVYRRQAFAWDLHMERLKAGLAALHYPTVDFAELKRAADILIGEGPEAESSVYIQISRGVQPRSHLFPSDTAPTVLVWVRPVAPLAVDLVEKGVGVITTPDDRWAKVWIKTVGLLPNVLAKQKAFEAGAFDAVFVRDGMVTESTSANLFIVEQERVRTAPVSNYILPGVTRRVVLELAENLGLTVDLRPFSVEQMLDADEVFLTGTLTEVLPIQTVDGRQIRGVGPISGRLLKALHERTEPGQR